MNTPGTKPLYVWILREDGSITKLVVVDYTEDRDPRYPRYDKIKFNGHIMHISRMDTLYKDFVVSFIDDDDRAYNIIKSGLNVRLQSCERALELCKAKIEAIGNNGKMHIVV